MNWLILSGGSGSTALYNGISRLDKNANIKFLINMYDDGKSTGVVRKVMNVLGPSDCRKTHLKIYKQKHCLISSNILDFYEKRYNFDSETVMTDILNELKNLNLLRFKDCVYEFFAQPNARSMSFKDFNLSNLVYSVLYARNGYEQTNAEMCKLLEIDDNVIMNSFDNVFIGAELESGNSLEDEAAIVSYSSSDRIKKIIYRGPEKITLNDKAIKAINEADNIIISSGTFWSSIFPTLEYGEMYKIINDSKAKKFWIMNTIEDKDSKDVTADDFYSYLKNLGLSIDDFTILENLDSIKNLQFKEKHNNVISKHLGNIFGKHDPDLLASLIILRVKNIELENIKNIVLDFDDTIYARNATDENKQTSKKILALLKNIEIPISIISGNTYEKIVDVFNELGIDFHDMMICANANSVIYHNNTSREIESFNISNYVEQIKNMVFEKYGLRATYSDDFHIKYWNLSELERRLLSEILNKFFKDSDCPCRADLTGRSTIDVMSVNNNKADVLKNLGKDLNGVLYIGDEIYGGNDKSITSVCNNFVNVENIDETLCVLKAISKGMNKCDMD